MTTRELLVYPVEWMADKVCVLLRHAGGCYVASAWYNSNLAWWAYRWNKPGD